MLSGRRKVLASSSAAVFLCAALATTGAAKRDAYWEGLETWRKPGATADHAACATCHSPDGIEIARYNFDDDDIFRRASQHLNPEDCQKVVDFIHSVREKYGFQKLLDPMIDRPFQPGGKVLPGATADERDKTFGEELEQRLPMFFKGRIETIDQAKAASAAFLKLDPLTLPIGIPLDRLSEDFYHGKEHATIAQWLPEIAPTIPAKDRAAWYAKEDDYLAKPTNEGLRHLLDLHQRLCNASSGNGLTAISSAKFRGLLLLQHRLRTGLAQTGSVAPEIGPPGDPNPIWEVGELARDLYFQQPAPLGMDAEMQKKKLIGPDLHTQMAELRSSWFWLGWLMDQGLYKTVRGSARYGDWLAQSLWLDGPYAIHNVYSSTRRQLVISFDPAAWQGDASRKRLFWDYGALRIGRRFINQAPTEPEHRKLYMTFAANCFRLNLLLLEADLLKTHQVWVRLNSSVNVRDLCDFVEMADPDSKPQTERLRNELLNLISNAAEKF
ncbi:MAG TPA: hypothetical protein VG944_07340 [Fimbriimonas sp.]|nr:hypothetical protein [Fimbriimonas sp.]